MKSLLIALVLLLLALSSCELFNNEEELPECVKQSQEDPSGTIYCFQPLYFGRSDWHPGGEWIAAEHSDSLDTDDDGIKDIYFSGIWLIDAQTGNTQPLLPFGQTPDWNPQGTHLVVEEGGRIYTVQITSLKPARYDTSSITLITDFDAPAFYPTWSGDGEWIAFDTNFEDSNGTYGIVKKNLKNHSLIDITKRREEGAWRQGDWSRRNSTIVLSKFGVNDGWNISKVDTNGQNLNQLTSNGDNYFPTYSFDGKKIAYIHGGGINTSIQIMDADGSNKKTVSKEWSTGIGWSPDGSKIAFVFSNQYKEVPGNGQLWVMDADGKNKKPLTNFEGELPR